jgi:hypothetical protein
MDSEFWWFEKFDAFVLAAKRYLFSTAFAGGGTTTVPLPLPMIEHTDAFDPHPSGFLRSSAIEYEPCSIRRPADHFWAVVAF